MLIGFPDMYLEWSKLLVDLKHQNPKLEVLLTVSPIRHTRKGIHENNVSKGILLQLCYELDMIFPYVRYFPSYEIVLDELRDYKYFKDDLIHPTDEAIGHIYQKFKAAYC